MIRAFLLAIATIALAAPRRSFCGRRQRGQEGQALGRSRGGFGTKIHLKTDRNGLPLGFELTGGEASDS
ncbi:hypothetical protein [Labrenzia sp. THAF82]|uniref:hypothetical protein n=1 Tax=Labrenzia sp. THAF82 TaxID=2587861 RepID=UPI001268EC2C